MNDGLHLSTNIDRTSLGKRIAERFSIWQMDFLTADKLASFSSRRSLTFWARHVVQLWRMGLLQADLIRTPRQLRRPGLVYVGKNEYGRYLYADVRSVPVSTGGWDQGMAMSKQLPEDAELLFHPFRLYVLYRLEKALATNIVPAQTMVDADRYHELLDWTLRNFKQWSGQDDTAKVAQHWNDVASLCVLAEPCVYTRMFETTHRPVHVDEKTQQARIDDHWNDVAHLFRQIGTDELEEIRRELCIDTQRLDPNPEVQNLVWLTSGERRLELEGHLGGAIYVRIMAEVIRRAEERIFDTKLREEDELGFGWTREDLKQRVSGASRLLDGNILASKEYLRHLGIRADLQLRWYVEGWTEYYALLDVFTDMQIDYILPINLFGQVAESGGKKGANATAFRDSLRADLHTHIFSFVSVDGDVPKNLSAVRQAAKADEICGAFFVAEPDFEFGNFDRSELEAVLWSIAQTSGVPEAIRETLHSAIQGTETGGELIEQAKRVIRDYIPDLGKGKEWGEALMRYAHDHPNRPDGRPRLILQALRMALSTWFANYLYQRREYRVDAATGLPVPKTADKEATEEYIRANQPWYFEIYDRRPRVARKPKVTPVNAEPAN